MSIFKACDVRGVVGTDWDEPEAKRIGQALATMLRRRGESRICVGGDFRRSTPRLKQAIMAGLLPGIEVVDVGQVPTPVVAFAARHMKIPNLAIITASHNPGQYNGVKFLVAGQPPTPALIAELQQSMTSEPASNSSGASQQVDILPAYMSWVVDDARQLVSGTAATQKPQGETNPPGDPRRPESITDPRPRHDAWRVAVDTMGGAFTHIAPRVLTQAGYHEFAVDTELDPDFSRRDPNPSHDRNLSLLRDAIEDQRCDMGLALDGDGDRVVFVDGAGQIARPEQIAVLLIERCYPQGTVVYDLKCASLVARAAQTGGGAAIMQPSGHGFIKSMMLERHAELGVEVSGHHFFGVLQGGDDGLFTALVVLGLLRQHGTTLASERQRIGWPCITPDLRLALEGDSGPLLEQIAGHCDGQVSRMDGVRAEYDDGWGLARASITEPALTLRFEGRDAEHLRQVATRFLTGVPHLLPRVLERIA